VLSLELFSILFWGIATYINSRNELTRSIGNQLYQVAIRMDNEIKGFFDPVTISISSLSNTIRGLHLSYKELVPVTAELFKSRPEIDELTIFGKEGNQLYRHNRLATDNNNPTRSLARDHLFQQTLSDQKNKGEIVYSKAAEPTLRLLFRLDDDNGHTLVIEALINLNWLWKLAQQQTVGESGIVYIVASDGKLVSYPDLRWVIDGQKVDDRLPKAFFSAVDNRDFQIYRNLNNKDVIGIGHYDKDRDWRIIVELPTNEGLQPLTRLLHWFIFIFACAAVLTTLIVLAFSRITMRPLENIMQAISRISNGERGVKLSVNTTSELSTLADGINVMSACLDERIDQLLESQTALKESKEKYKLLNINLEMKIDVATRDLQETNRKLTESVKLAKDASQSKSMFLANTSHELRTPLNAILGYSELIQEIAEENNDEQLVNDTNKIIYSAKYLLDLINNLLDLAKIEKGKLHILPEQFSLKDFLDSLVCIIKPLADSNQNRFSLECADGIDVVTTDITRLRQIIINLISNACKFTKNGEVNLSIYSLKIRNIHYLHFCVSDTGIGMTPEQTDRLFEVFQQADARTTRRFGGSGLGLALSKQLALLMKGNILASSVYGQGSDFTLVIPLNYFDVQDNRSVQGNIQVRNVS